MRGEPNASPARPTIDADRCVHSLCATASCRACADVCPRGAIQLTDVALGIDEEACDGCGLCRPACPQSAIELAGIRFDALLDQNDEIALLACSRAGVTDGRGVVPCLHAVGERDLAPLGDHRIEALVTARGDCATCPSVTAATLDLSIARLNTLSEARGGARWTVNIVAPGDWMKRRARALRAGGDVDPGRRNLFSSVLVGRPSAPAKAVAASYRFVPEIDALACVGCDACSRICPHGAITFSSNAHETSYSLDPKACTGCGLCRDVCEAGAVAIHELVPAQNLKVRLSVYKCSKCGGPFHSPLLTADEIDAEKGRPEPAICRICRRTSHASQLFQVRT